MYISVTMRQYTIILLSISVSLKVNTEVYSSTSKLEILLTTQKNIIDSLNNFMKSDKIIKNKIIRNHLQRFEKEHQMATKDIPKYLGNPVNSFRLIKRLKIDFKLIENTLSTILDFERNQSLTYPTRKDLEGAAEGLLRLESTYSLNRSQIASGLWNTSYGKDRITYFEVYNPMTISDCYELGKALYNIKYYSSSIEWLKEAGKKYSDERHRYPEDSKITLENIINQISNGYNANDRISKKFEKWFREISVRMPNIEKMSPSVIIRCFKKGLKPLAAVEAIKTEHRAINASLSYRETLEMNETYNALCKGEMKIDEKIYKDMKCYLAHGPHPFLKLAPMKAERLHCVSNVILFHNVINDAEIKIIQNLTLPKLRREQYDRHRIFYANDRICQVGIVQSNESVVTARLRARVSDFTGMNLDASEQMQVANYGIGGHFSPHYDYWSNDTYIAQVGNRIATVLFYMSDVEQGGATVFLRLGLTVFPMKGAALFWINLSPLGMGNPYTYHSACPVLRGSKWVITQWINLLGQELNRPCPLNGKVRIK